MKWHLCISKCYNQIHSEERTRAERYPPLSTNIATDVGKKFLGVVKESFTARDPMRNSE